MIYRYIFKEYLKFLFLTIGVFTLIFFVSNFFDSISRFGSADIGLKTFITFLIIKIPYLISKVAVLIALISSLLFINHFITTNQIIPLLSSGRSMLHLSIPIVIAMLLFGILNLCIITPVGSVLLAKHDNMIANIFKNTENAAQITNKSIILIENTDNYRRVVIAKKIDIDQKMVHDTTIISLDQNNRIVSEYNISSAKLDNGKFTWQDQELPTKLSITDFTKNISPPENHTIWELGSIIKRLGNLGLDVTMYQIHYYSELSKPLIILSAGMMGLCFFNIAARKNNFSTLSKNLSYAVGVYVVFTIIAQILSHKIDSVIISTLIFSICIFLIISLLVYRINSKI